MKTLYDTAGRKVHIIGQTWHLNEPGKTLTINWEPIADLPQPLLDAAKRYVALQIRMRSNASAIGTMTALRALTASGEAVLRTDGVFGVEWFGHLRATGCCSTYLHRLRAFYCDAAQAHLAGFSESAAYALHAVRIGGNPVGEHARRARTNRGAFSSAHLDLLVQRLFGPLGLLLDPTARAALQLCLAYFPNSGPLSLIYCHDHSEEDGTLLISRHKKRRPPREAFRERPAQEAGLVQILSEAKAAAFERASQFEWQDGSVGLPPGTPIPLFVRERPLRGPGETARSTDPMTFQMSANEVADLVREACFFLLPEAGELTPRRFRMTVPTILLQRGVKPEVIADILDHKGGVSYVLKTYAAGGARIVDHLDKATKDPKRRKTVGKFAAALGL